MQESVGVVVFMVLLLLALDLLSPVLSRHLSKSLAGRRVQQSALLSFQSASSSEVSTELLDSLTAVASHRTPGVLVPLTALH